MKLIIMILAMTVSFAAFSQEKSKPDTTVKPVPIQQPQPTYFLLGTVDYFNTLLSLLDEPDNFSKNQRKELAAWVRKAQVLPDQKPPEIKKNGQ